MRRIVEHTDTGKYKVRFIAEECWEKKLVEGVKYIIDDIDSICERDPAARNRAEVLLLYSGVHALIMYRFAHVFHVKGWKFPARALSQFARFLTGVESI